MVVNVQRTHVDDEQPAYMCDKTAGEMMQAMESKTIVLWYEESIVESTDLVICAPIVSVRKTPLGRYTFETFFLGGDKKEFIANDESAYPYCVTSK